MVDMEFGKVIEKLIYFSGQKNYSLAKEVGYDVSYISKWISGAMLPTAKNVKIICEKIAHFIVKNMSESSKNEIINYFYIDIDKYDTDELLVQYIEKILNESYSISNEKKNKKIEEMENHQSCNSSLYVNPRFIKKDLDEKIMHFTKNERHNDVILLGDLFSLSRDDRLHTAGIRIGSTVKTEMKNARMRFLISFDENNDDIIFNTILFMNMIKNYSNIDFKLYSCKHSQYSLTTVVKDKSFTNTVYTDTKKCLFTNVSEDKSVVEDMYTSLEEMITSRSRLTFLEKNPKEMILDKNYIQYMIGRDIRWLIGSVNELFMPSDLFLEIGQQVFGESKEVLDELKQIDAILQHAIYESDIQVIMYESAIRQYTSTGKLSFFNTNITLTLEQRQRHIYYMEKLLKENQSINIKLINGNLIEDFKDKENPSAFISKSVNFIKINYDEDNSLDREDKYLIVRDERLDNIFKIFFQELWECKIGSITKDREEAVERVSDLLNYVNIMMKLAI
ncbi:MAG: helix-turn-helix domain-containing protein [Peptostreptococcaceae bacterium]